MAEENRGAIVTSTHECGSYHDNQAVFVEAQVCLTLGRAVDSRELCRQLRVHILRTPDEKSVKWLLPRVDALLEGRLAN